MEKNTLITIFVLFVLSNQLYNIFWEILKAIFYLYAIVLGLDYINPSVAETLKKYLSLILQFDQNILQSLLSAISTEIINFFKNNLNSNNDIKEQEIPKEIVEIKQEIPEENRPVIQYDNPEI